MTIDKAIHALNDILTYVKPGDPPDEHDAIKLGIEALKFVQRIHPRGKYPQGKYPLRSPLPGETEE